MGGGDDWHVRRVQSKREPEWDQAAALWAASELHADYEGFWGRDPRNFERLFVLVEEGAVCGFVVTDEDGTLMVIRQLVVVLELRSGGRGARLVREVASDARSRQIATVLVSAVPGPMHDRLLRYYERLGFHRPGYMGQDLRAAPEDLV